MNVPAFPNDSRWMFIVAIRGNPTHDHFVRLMREEIERLGKPFVFWDDPKQRAAYQPKDIVWTAVTGGRWRLRSITRSLGSKTLALPLVTVTSMTSGQRIGWEPRGDYSTMDEFFRRAVALE